ncbi:kinase-like domain-containing protein [Gaertneriomyces semiglobifer]|nr:kinase-like domain-containing protein [Gaertneriomyces semiglobifer]
MVVSLFTAAASSLDDLKSLLEDPETVDAGILSRDTHDWTLLHHAAHANHQAVVDYILAQPNAAEIINAINVAGDTPLSLAARKGYVEVVRALVKAGADANKANDHGNAPLHYAVFFRWTEIVNILFKEAGAYAAVKNKYGRMPVDKAPGGEIAAILGEVTASLTPLLAPARTFQQAKEEAKARFLTRAGVDFEISPRAVQLTDDILPTTRYITHSLPTASHPPTVSRMGKWNNYTVVVKLTPVVAAEEQREAFRECVNELRKVGVNAALHPILAFSAADIGTGVVTAWVEHGSAYAFLHDPACEMTQAMAMEMCIGVAKGLQYLHEKGVPHGGLKSGNVLLAPDGTVKLTDYGFHHHMSSLPPGFTPRLPTNKYLYDVEWLAPEILRGESSAFLPPPLSTSHSSLENISTASNQKENMIKFLTAADIYAYGIFLHEVVTRAYPYELMNATVIGMKVALEGLRPKIPEWVPTHLAFLMTACWMQSPAGRPAADKVVRTLLDERWNA